METFQPRYVAYAKSLGIAPENVFEHDGSMANFIGWITEYWRDYRKLRGIPSEAPVSDADHKAFDAWLIEQLDIEIDLDQKSREPTCNLTTPTPA
jgi:hypothetical protein